MRRFSSWLTSLILLVAALPLGVAGCGGGGGPAGSAISRDHFGQVTLRVIRHEGPPQARVVGDQVLLETSESTRRLVVKFSTLPLQESSSPVLVRDFDLSQGQTRAVVDQIPAPAWYRIQGYLYEGDLSDYASSFVAEVEVLPGVTSTTTATLTPNVSTLKRLELSPLAPTVAAGLGQQFYLTGIYSDESHRDVTSLATWSSSDESIATVSNQPGNQGFATALKPGQASIRADIGGISASTPLQVTAARLVSLTVTPAGAQVPQGFTRQFTATGLFSDATTQDLSDQVTWESSEPSIATVSNAPGTWGLATAVATGQTTVSATFGSQIRGQATLTVLPADGTQKWQINVNPSVEGLGPALGTDGTVYFGNGRGEVYAINPADGTTRWLAALPEGYSQGGGWPTAPSVGPDGTIYVTHARSGNPGILYALSPTDGSVKWSVQGAGSLTPAIGNDGYVYVSADDSKVAAINPAEPTGFAWSYTLTEAASRGPILGSDGTVYVITRWRLRAIQYSPIQGAAIEKWAVDLVEDGGIPAIADDGTIYVATKSTLFSINPAGFVNWTYSYPLVHTYTPDACVLGADGNVYVTNDTCLYSITPGATQGTLNWKFLAADGFTESPAVASDGRIYFASGSYIYAVAPTGDFLWKFQTGADLRGFTIGGEGTIFGVTDSTVSAIYGSFPLADSPWPIFNGDVQHSGRR